VAVCLPDRGLLEIGQRLVRKTRRFDTDAEERSLSGNDIMNYVVT
jgi:hypothetical protein